MNIRENCKMKPRREICLACGHRLLSEPLPQLSGMPASAQDIPVEEELADDCGVELNLCQCPSCGLLQFDCEPVDYYRDVIRAVGLSETMRALRRADYRHMIDAYGLSGKKFIECGCGRGEFMEVLKEFPAEIYATEANAEFAGDARKLLGPDCHVLHFFPENAGMQIDGAPFDCFFSFNFLEHQPDPSAMLGCMYRNLAPGGYGLITVPSFEYILQDGRYYELIRDHIANYTLSSLGRLCRDCGFEILESGSIGIGDTLRVVVRKPLSDTVETAVHSACMGILAAFQREKRFSEGNAGENAGEAVGRFGGVASGANTAKMTQIPMAEIPCDVSSLKQNYTDMREKMAAFTAHLKENGMKLALFGAGHQGFTIAATTALSEYAAYIMDSAPFKQGRFAPASHIPIVSPEYFAAHPVDVVMVTAPGYVKEITAQLRKRYPDHPALRICTIEPESWPDIF